jgi:GH18 family chitinase
MKRNLLFTAILTCVLNVIFAQTPATPVISWMETNYQLIEGSVDIQFTWDMWWGENGDHWKLIQNGSVVYENEIISNSPLLQNSSATISISSTGSYNFTVSLCNGIDVDEECSTSNVVTILVGSDGGGGEVVINHGNGIDEWGYQYFSPFVDATGWPPFSLVEMAQITGVKYYNLGFIVAKGIDECIATWGGYYTLDGMTFAEDFMFPLIEDNEIGELRAMGGDVMVSIGGAANTPLASSTNDLEELKTQYRDIIDTYDLTHIDFDIEGTWILDTDASLLRAQALADLQEEWAAEGRDVKIWFTLPVLPLGLTTDGVNLLTITENAGVEIAGVNIMAMDYGDGEAPNPDGLMGYYAIESAISLHSQIMDIFTGISAEEAWQMVGVTPMIGINDVTTEIFDLGDAQELLDFSLLNGIKELSMWSVNRDFECEGGVSTSVLIDCSSILQDDYAFSEIFNTITENPLEGEITFDKNIVGYYTSWSVYGRDYEVEDIPVDKVNIINYAFANINPNSGTIVLGDPYADIDQYYPGDSWDAGALRGNFHRLQLLKEENSHLSTMISVGGWTWSAYFSDIAMTDATRTVFAQSCVEFIVEYGFDGIDYDWEYPVEGGLDGNHHDPDDKVNLTLLLQKTRELLDVQEAIDGNEYLLSIATSASPMMSSNLELDILHEYVDFINIMSYDFHGPWGGLADNVTNFNAALFPATGDLSPSPYNEAFNMSAAVQLYLESGVPAEKINAGMPFYGRSFGGVADVNNGLYQEYDGVPEDGTWEDGVFDYYDLVDNYIDMNGYTKFWHDEAKVPWLYSPTTGIMISYDDEESISEKCQYILDSGIGGAMYWEFSGDRHGYLADVTFDVLTNGSINECAGISGDLNGDGIVSVNDILELLSEFGCIAECDSDVDGDAAITVNDLLLVLSNFGTECL